MNKLIRLQLLWHLMRLRGRRYWTRQQVQAHQDRALGHLRAYAYAHSPFYQRFHHGLMDRPLQELPVLTKALMMEHFDDLVTDPTVRLADVEAHVATMRGDECFLGQYWVTATSGRASHCCLRWP